MEQESALAWEVEEVAQDPEPGLAQAQVPGQVHIPHLHLIPVLALPVVQALALKRAPMPALVLGQAPGEVEEMVVDMAVVVGTVRVLEGEVGQTMVKAMARAEAMVKVMAAGATTEINLSSYIAAVQI